MMKRQGATTAAEALASALAAWRNIEALVNRYDVEAYEITREGSVVTVRVERNGVARPFHHRSPSYT